MRGGSFKPRRNSAVVENFHRAVTVELGQEHTWNRQGDSHKECYKNMAIEVIPCEGWDNSNNEKASMTDASAVGIGNIPPAISTIEVGIEYHLGDRIEI